MLNKIFGPRNKITLVFEVYTDGPMVKTKLGNAARSDDSEFLESGLQVALSELALVQMDSIDVRLTMVQDGVET